MSGEPVLHRLASASNRIGGDLEAGTGTSRRPSLLHGGKIRRRPRYPSRMATGRKLCVAALQQLCPIDLILLHTTRKQRLDPWLAASNPPASHLCAGDGASFAQ
jgi:hypothetical protein